MAFSFPFAPQIRNNSDLLLSIGSGLIGGRTAQEQGALAAQGAAQTIQANRQRNRTVELLRQEAPDLAAAVEAGALDAGNAFKLFSQQKLEAQRPNIMNIGGAGYDAKTGQWITPPPGVGGEQETFYGNPIPIQTADGIKYGQIGSRGSFKPIDIGQGNTFAPAVKTVDTGTGTALVGPGGVQVGSPIQKDLRGAESQKAEGKIEGESTGNARASFPAAQQAAQDVASQVERLKNDPDLPSVLGPIDSRTPNWSRGANRVQAYIDQLAGGAFLQARTLLKGGGQITDFEGRKAEQAFIRLNQAQDPADFKAALDDFNDAVQAGIKKLQAAGSSQATGPVSAAPTGRRLRYNPQTGRAE